jgi:hypothetical protein
MKAKQIKSYRSSPRRMIEPLEVSSVTLLDNLTKLAREAEIVEASVSGFLLIVKREHLVPKALRENLSLESVIGSTILIHMPQMNLEISGKIARTKLLGKKGFELGVDYSADSPEYWRECLLDLLPSPGEFDEE